MFADVIQILIIGKIIVGPVGLHKSYFAVIKIKGAVVCNRPDMSHFDNTKVLDGIHVFGKDIFLGKLDGEQRKVKQFLGMTLDLRTLARTYLRVMERFAASHPPPLRLLPLRFRVEDKMAEIYARVAEEGSMPLLSHLHSRPDPEEVVTLVVAVLELARLGGIAVTQRRAFAEIDLKPGPNTLEASMAKAKGGRWATLITQKACELLGPEGLSAKELPEKWFRDSKILDIFEGTGQIQHLIIARNILKLSSKELR